MNAAPLLVAALSCLGCSPPPAGMCLQPPYEDLSRWAPRPAALEEDCGVAIGATIQAGAGSARVLYGLAFPTAGMALYVTAHMRRLVGTGKISGYLWDDGPLVAAVPTAEGFLTLLAVPSGEEVRIGFLGEAGEEPLTFEVRQVVITEIEWQK